MQFSKVIVALAAVASVQAANNSSESSSVSTAGAAVNTYERVMEIAHESGLLALAAGARPRKRLRRRVPRPEVISLLSSEGNDELEVTNSTDSDNELSGENLVQEAVRLSREQTQQSQRSQQSQQSQQSQHSVIYSQHLQQSQPSTHSPQAASQSPPPPLAVSPTVPQSTQDNNNSITLKTALPHLAKPIVLPPQPRYRVGLSKRARVDPLHSYLHPRRS
ncbi:hypothetical protein OGAPHI_003029 [Ogataea philodendri]|uniref:Secreted protein n=1 Tax=Ogataea philodendri TaxID=1378263 RepID=A0A9P8P8X4_9ASCO|nr:uncharacterized protein OGAPHI_003029 [Ogataea philodendri]KAH3667380.1 hypothetical protein OGAPHI_003029 [Ogataea philodendri]